ncbi:hypothetical protein F4809DRAFT_628652 [Biscogniauxia mediterranea]|nr:hypothetical protein F4809DRAFT_628652 [Biscogniauxia mediterranea]
MVGRDSLSSESSAFCKWCESAWRTRNSAGSMTLCDPDESYRAIVHVWRYGTGGGMKDADVVDECLFELFATLATDLDYVRIGCQSEGFRHRASHEQSALAI